MRDDVATLAEIMFLSEQYCVRVEAVIAKAGELDGRWDEVRLKIGQSRAILAVLQTAYDEDELTLQNRSVRANFRTLIMGLLWTAFQARDVIDRRIFRMLVLIESSFTYLLVRDR